jgi:hypothetical protein
MAKNNIFVTVLLVLCIMGGGLHAQQIIQVTDEIPCDAAPTVSIGNIIRRVTVRTTNENKVRLVSTVAVEGNCRYTNEEWLRILELKVSGSPGYVNVECGIMAPTSKSELKSPGSSFKPFFGKSHHTADLPQRQTHNNLTPGGTVVFDSNGQFLYREGLIRRDIIVYVPEGSRLDIDSRYAEIILDSNIREVDARISSGGLTMKDAGKFVLASAYGSIYAENIGDAEVALHHGWFHAKNIPTLDINSMVSNVELGAIGRLKINSNDDQYEMEGAGTVYGEKNYGSIRIDTLRNSLDLRGVNSDIKLHEIAKGVSLIKIDDQYADLRLPVDNLKDYTVHFEGQNCNLYVPFGLPHATDPSFSVTVGTGKKNAFQLKCNNCSVDMK